MSRVRRESVLAQVRQGAWYELLALMLGAPLAIVAISDNTVRGHVEVANGRGVPNRAARKCVQRFLETLAHTDGTVESRGRP